MRCVIGEHVGLDYLWRQGFLLFAVIAWEGCNTNVLCIIKGALYDFNICFL